MAPKLPTNTKTYDHYNNNAMARLKHCQNSYTKETGYTFKSLPPAVHQLLRKIELSRA